MDGHTLDPSELEARGINTDGDIFTRDGSTAFIIIPSTDNNDGIEIVCVAVTSSFKICQESTSFIVTDIPVVRDLDVQFNDAVMIATWIVPSCLPVNYCYHVTVSNADTTTITTNTTSTQYQMPEVSSCVNYTISVTVMDTGPLGYESRTAIVTGKSGYVGGKVYVDSDKINFIRVFVNAEIKLLFDRKNLEVSFTGVKECDVVVPFTVSLFFLIFVCYY